MKAKRSFNLSPLSRLLSSFFTALPGFLFMTLLLLSDLWGSEPWWEMFLAVLIILSISSLLSGLVVPALFQRVGVHRSWIWIMVQGSLSWVVTLLLLGIFSMTPLCIGQENGDGVNNLAACMERAVMSGLVCTPVYFSLLIASAFFGNWVIKLFEQSITGR